MDMLSRTVQGLYFKYVLILVIYLICVNYRFLANSQNALVEKAGYLQAADANDVILIFPEARWRGYDVVGYTGPEEFSKSVSNWILLYFYTFQFL